MTEHTQEGAKRQEACSRDGNEEADFTLGLWHGRQCLTRRSYLESGQGADGFSVTLRGQSETPAAWTLPLSRGSCVKEANRLWAFARTGRGQVQACEQGLPLSPQAPGRTKE